MAERASVLLYNFTDKKRTEKVKFIFVLLGIKIKNVRKEEYLQPIGTLAGLPGMEAEEECYEGEGFPEEMIVLTHFTDGQLNQMLAYLRKERIQIPLKAAVTPTNQHWDSLKLHDEIKREHEQMEQMKKKS